MPSHFEYVISAYGIWAFVFAAYVLWLVRRLRAVKRQLEQVSRQGTRPAPGSR